jgi:hypothetical protein
MNSALLTHNFLTRLYPKLKTWFALSVKTLGFRQKLFPLSLVYGEIEKVKLSSHKGFSLCLGVAKNGYSRA